jgi:23S rRNA (uracil1939-C5)-methyltransferase
MHRVKLNSKFEVYTDNLIYQYRNKMEYAFWWEKEKSTLDLAFFKRSSHAKIPIQQSSLAMEDITKASKRLLEILRNRKASGSDLKTVIIRASQNHEVAIQLYVKNKKFEIFSDDELSKLDVKQFQVIYSEPKSPASVITKKLQTFGKGLNDMLLGKSFRYSTEGFFQVNLPVYERALYEHERLGYIKN